MPHLILEYTNNIPLLQVNQILVALNQTLAASGEFIEADIKSRAMEFAHFQIGIQSEPRAFIHVKLALLQGRSISTKQYLSKKLLDILEQFIPQTEDKYKLQLCVEIQDIERDSYSKILR